MQFSHLQHGWNVYFIICVITVGVLLGMIVYGCSDKRKNKRNLQRTSVTKQEAIKLAVKALQARGENLNFYNQRKKVRETESEWVVYFEWKPPVPPASPSIVHVSKVDGSVRIVDED